MALQGQQPELLRFGVLGASQFNRRSEVSPEVRASAQELGSLQVEHRLPVEGVGGSSHKHVANTVQRQPQVPTGCGC